MKYENIYPAIFLERPNRFIAHIEIDGKTEICHVKNTGRCKEILVPGTKIFVQKQNNPNRKTKYDLIAAYKGDMLINIDSQAPNKVFGEWLKTYFEDASLVKPEKTYKNSRFDFYVETNNKRIFIEVKGVTLEKDGVLLFPDAPTERGVKHLNELAELKSEGYDAYVFFIVQMGKALYFSPNSKTHPEFAAALENAQKKGVKICCVNCNVEPDSLSIKDFVEVKF